MCFKGSASRIGGVTFEILGKEVVMFCTSFILKSLRNQVSSITKQFFVIWFQLLDAVMSKYLSTNA